MGSDTAASMCSAIAVWLGHGRPAQHARLHEVAGCDMKQPEDTGPTASDGEC